MMNDFFVSELFFFWVLYRHGGEKTYFLLFIQQNGLYIYIPTYISFEGGTVPKRNIVLQKLYC